ncbi:ATP-dependent DNA helicase PIF1 [Linum perenne]
MPPRQSRKRPYEQNADVSLVHSAGLPLPHRFVPPRRVPVRRFSGIDRRSRLFHMQQSEPQPVPESQFSSDYHVSSDIVSTSSPTAIHHSLSHDTGSTYDTNQHIFPLESVHYLGRPEMTCQYCDALFWVGERLAGLPRRDRPVYTQCCNRGMVSVPFLLETPPFLNTLLDVHGDEDSKNFRKHARSYNAAFSFTSFGAKIDSRIVNSRGPFSLILCGENYHLMGSLLPPPGEPPKYAQLYVFDPAGEMDQRLANFSGPNQRLIPAIMTGLQMMLDETNVLVQSFRRIRGLLATPENRNLRLRIVAKRTPIERQYELPTGTELAGLIPDDFQPDHQDRDIIIHSRQSGLVRISSIHPKFDALHFPLLFPHGNDGFHLGIRYHPSHVLATRKREHVTRLEYYCFRLQYRRSEGTTLIRGGKILQHFCIDAYTSIEEDRLWYVRKNQKELRSDLYRGLVDAFNQGDTNAANMGQVILPSTFTDAKLVDPDHIDKVICAELPNPRTDPQGFSAVTRFMVHGPCGGNRPTSLCMEDGKCKKLFPKSFSNETAYDDNGYVTYRRRDTGQPQSTTINPQPVDEVSQYLDCRSISCYEAVWHLFEFQIHERHPSVTRLAVHLPGQQTVAFHRNETIASIVSRRKAGCTTLTEWFELNKRCPSARKYTYGQIPNYFTWNKKDCVWHPRQKGFAVGRVIYVNPRAEECFYLRMLLTKIRGAVSYEALRTVGGVTYNKFKEACEILGLLSTDDEWDNVMEEVSQWGHPAVVRNVFASLLVFCQQQQAISSRATLNEAQLSAYFVVMDSIDTCNGGLFFLYGHGGTGKTYLYNTIVSEVRSRGLIALVVASSGIAATLLPDASTAQSRFKIPLEVHHTSTCTLRKDTQSAEIIKAATLIVWDEAPMVHRLSFEAVDRSICDIMGMPLSGSNYRPFGGKSVLLGGDFRQTLPVIAEGSRTDCINASLTRSPLWCHCKLLHLTHNMRISDSSSNLVPVFQDLNFSDWVLAMGDGQLPLAVCPRRVGSDFIDIPPRFFIERIGNDLASIVNTVYPHFCASFMSQPYIKERAIVTPTNKLVSSINDHILSLVPGDARTYFSLDSIVPEGNASPNIHTVYPIEFLNTLSFNGVPEHAITLKEKTPVMILRNINPALGLCNGTRVFITKLCQHVLKGVVIGGFSEGTLVAIPRIVLDVTGHRWPFTLRRRQFPVRTCYAMTINKSQGQTLDVVGLYLPTPVFSHGQLYVAVSRVRSVEGLHIMLGNSSDADQTVTRNIVYDEIFSDL